MASLRHQRRRSCESKRQYTEQEARRIVYKIGTGTDNLGYYRCQFCGNYHVGHKPKKMLVGKRIREERRYA